MHYVCALFIQLLITLFSLVMIIPPLIIAVPNVLALKNTVIFVRLFEERSPQWAASFIKILKWRFQNKARHFGWGRRNFHTQICIWKNRLFSVGCTVTLQTGTDEEKILEKWAIGQDADRAEYESYPDVKRGVWWQAFRFSLVVMETFHFNLC